MTSLVGEPVQIIDGKVGQFYNEDIRNLEMQKGEWTDHILNDCFHDPFALLLSCCCPCFITYQVLERTGPVDTHCSQWAGRFGGMKYIMAFAALFLFAVFFAGYLPSYPPGCKDTPLRRPGSAHEQRMSSKFQFDSCKFKSGDVLTQILGIVLAFEMLRGVRMKVNVTKESDGMTFAKSICCPMVFFPICCIIPYPFFLAQVHRHVETLQGFKPAKGVGYNPVYANNTSNTNVPVYANTVNTNVPTNAPIVEGTVVELQNVASSGN